MVIENLTAILVFVTTIYVYLTYRMAKATEASADATMRPYVTVAPYVRPHTAFLYLRVENSGRTAAEDLRLTIDRNFYQFGNVDRPESNLRTMSAFTAPIDSLPPGNQLNFALGQGWVIFGEKARTDIMPPQFNVTISYKYRGKVVEEISRIDLRPYIGSEGDRDPIVEELERIRQTLERLK